MNSPKLSKENKNQVKTGTLSHLKDLIMIDGVSTTRLILECFTGDHDRILKELELYPEVQFRYLQTLMTKDKKSEMGELIEKSGVGITPELKLLYIKLMCQYDPSNVYKYLTANDDYPLDPCLKLCQKYGIKNGTIYLLERMGDFSGALEEVLKVCFYKIEWIRY